MPSLVCHLPFALHLGLGLGLGLGSLVCHLPFALFAPHYVLLILARPGFAQLIFPSFRDALSSTQICLTTLSCRDCLINMSANSTSCRCDFLPHRWHVAKDGSAAEYILSWTAHKHHSIKAIAVSPWGEIWTGAANGCLKVWSFRLLPPGKSTTVPDAQGT